MELDFLHALQNLRSEWLDTIVLHLTDLGDGGFIWIVTSILMTVLPALGKETRESRKKRGKTGVCMIISLIITVVIVNIVLKHSVQRLRPFQVDRSIVPLITPSDYSFPSGHTASSFAASTSILLQYRKWGIAAIVLAGVIAFTRLYLFVHFPTDVLVGMLIGIAVAVGVSAFMKKKDCFGA